MRKTKHTLRLLQGFCTLCGGPNPLPMLNLLHAFQKQNGLSDLLQTSYALCKPTLRSSRNLLHALWSWKVTILTSTSFAVVITDSLNLYKPHTHSAVVKTRSPNFYNLPTRFEVARTNPSRIYKLSSLFVFVNSDSLNFFKLPTPFVEDKTDSPIFYKPYTRIAEGKTDSQNIYKPYTSCKVCVRLTVDFNFVRTPAALRAIVAYRRLIARARPRGPTSFALRPWARYTCYMPSVTRFEVRDLFFFKCNWYTD